MSRSEIERDLYAILGVAPTASGCQIRQAYRREAMRWHPDLHASKRGVAEERMKEINAAATVLLVPARRAVYDQLRRAHRATVGGRPGCAPQPAPRSPAPPPRPPSPPKPEPRRPSGSAEGPEPSQSSAPPGAPPPGFAASGRTTWTSAAPGAPPPGSAASWRTTWTSAPPSTPWPAHSGWRAAPRDLLPIVLAATVVGVLFLLGIIAGAGKGGPRGATVGSRYRPPAWKPTPIPWTPPAPAPTWSTSSLEDYRAEQRRYEAEQRRFEAEERRYRAEMRRIDRRIRALNQQIGTGWSADVSPAWSIASAGRLSLAAQPSGFDWPVPPIREEAPAVKAPASGGDKWWGSAGARSTRASPGAPRRSFWGDLAGQK